MNFADVAAPLHRLTEKGVQYIWTQECDTSFNLLKGKLTQAPILAYSTFGPGAGQFILATDATCMQATQESVRFWSRKVVWLHILAVPFLSLNETTVSFKRNVWPLSMLLNRKVFHNRDGSRSIAVALCTENGRPSMSLGTCTARVCEDVIDVPLIPLSLRGDSLESCHNAPGAGHKGVEKSLARLRQEAYWHIGRT